MAPTIVRSSEISTNVAPLVLSFVVSRYDQFRVSFTCGPTEERVSVALVLVVVTAVAPSDVCAVGASGGNSCVPLTLVNSSSESASVFANSSVSASPSTARTLASRPTLTAVALFRFVAALRACLI